LVELDFNSKIIQPQGGEKVLLKNVKNY